MIRAPHPQVSSPLGAVDCPRLHLPDERHLPEPCAPAVSSHSGAARPTVADTGREGAPQALPAANSRESGSRADGAAHDTRRKLTDEQVVEIRRRWAEGEPARSLAAAFGVSTNTVHAAATGKRYAHIPGATSPRRRAAVIGQDDIQRLAETGATQTEAARDLGVSASGIRRASRRYGVALRHGSRFPDLSESEAEEYLFLTRRKRLSRAEALAVLGRSEMVGGA